MKIWKIALGLATAGAVAAPILVGTWYPRSNAQQWIALTADERANLTAKMEESKNCRVHEARVEEIEIQGAKPDMTDLGRIAICHINRARLNGGGRWERYLSLPRYLVTNGAILIASFVGIFGLALAVTNFLRRYSRWLYG